ncbi:MAG: 30S ribosomal protein S6 [Candidatus Gracilibacteria bacterium]
MKYEIMLILSPKFTDKELEKMLKETKGTLTENGFTIIDEDIWGMRDLAYKISGQTRGYYVVMTFSGEPSGVPAVHKDLCLQSGLVRYLLTKVANDYVLMRYEGGLQMAKTANAKLSSPAEELSKKVRSRKPKAEKVEESKEKNEELDEKLKAIIEDKDIL